MERRLIIREDERNEILNLHKKFILEQENGQPQVEMYGEGKIHWNFPQFNNDPSVTYNVEIKCVKNCEFKKAGVDTFSFKKDNMVNDSTVYINPNGDSTSNKSFQVKVDAVKDGKIVGTAIKNYPDTTGSPSLTKFGEGYGANIQPTFQTPQKTESSQANEKAMYNTAKQWIINNKINLSDTPENILNSINTWAQQTDKDGNNTSNTNLVPYIKKEIENQSGGKISFSNVVQSKSADGNTTTTTTAAPQVSTPIQRGVKNPKVEALQNKLNEKFKSGLVPDGKWGPKTAAAVQTALASLNTSQSTTTTTTAAQTK